MRKNSGMKRGLATVAVSALALTGLPFLMSPASADSLADQAGGPNAVVLLAPETGASVKNDGVNTTVHLLATAGANAAKVRFEYKGLLDPTPTTIATVTRANGAFSTEWTVPIALHNDLGTTVRAVALTAADIELTTDTELVQVGTAAESVDVANAAGSGLGVFVQPYTTPGNTKSLAAVSGTTSDLAANPALTLDSPSGTGGNMSEDWVGEVAPGATSRAFSGPVDLSGYSWDPTAPIVDEAAVRVTAGSDSDDAEVVNLYKQTITTVNAVASPASVQGAGTTTGLVTVLDGQGKPVVGAQVIRTGGPTVYTDSRGIASFPGLTGSMAGTAYEFVVNTTDNPAYESLIDHKRTVTVTSYAPEATALTAASEDGAAFDDDEFAAGDIQITVKDQNNNPLAGEEVTYFWHVAPFATTAGYPKDLAPATAGDNADGTYDVAFPAGEPSGTYTLNYYINTDGTPGEGPTDLAGTDLVVTAGEAALTWKDGATAQAPAGTTATFEGVLKLEDGTALAGRTVDIDWSKTLLGDAVVAAQPAQPAGTTRVSNTEATAVTRADGTFGIAIVDPEAAPKVDELDGDLDADTTVTPAAPTLDVDFLKNSDPSTPADITISDDELIDGLATPGRPVDIDVNVENSDNVDLTDYPVTIKVDHGFLSPNAETAAALVADPAPAEGGLYGEWKSEGSEKELTTDDSGNTGAVVAIEEDAAFATSDTVTTTVTVTAGTVSKTFTVDFTSENPLNGGEVRVELAAPADQSVTVLPKAPTTETVKYDLFVEDQFGNLVDGESVDLTDNLAGAKVNTVDGATTANSQLENEAPALTLSSTVAGSQTVSADWVVDSNTWMDDVAPGVNFVRDSGNEDTTLEDDAAPVEWYAIDYAASHYGMTHTGGDTLPVGSTSTVTYKAVDQFGEPIEGLQVNFFRAGPDDEQDGAGDSAVETNANGEAQYVFQGIKRGTAIIETVVREPLPSTTIIQAAGVNHVVKFGSGKKAINAKIVKARSQGNKDVLTVNAPRAARGAKVLMYGKIGGKVVKVGKARLNNRGRATLKVRDRNGNKVTQYVAIVRSTSRTQQDATPVKRVR